MKVHEPKNASSGSPVKQARGRPKHSTLSREENIQRIRQAQAAKILLVSPQTKAETRLQALKQEYPNDVPETPKRNKPGRLPTLQRTRFGKLLQELNNIEEFVTLPRTLGRGNYWRDRCIEIIKNYNINVREAAILCSDVVTGTVRNQIYAPDNLHKLKVAIADYVTYRTALIKITNQRKHYPDLDSSAAVSAALTPLEIYSVLQFVNVDRQVQLNELELGASLAKRDLYGSVNQSNTRIITDFLSLRLEVQMIFVDEQLREMFYDKMLELYQVKKFHQLSAYLVHEEGKDPYFMAPTGNRRIKVDTNLNAYTETGSKTSLAAWQQAAQVEPSLSESAGFSITKNKAADAFFVTNNEATAKPAKAKSKTQAPATPAEKLINSITLAKHYILVAEDSTTIETELSTCPSVRTGKILKGVGKAIGDAFGGCVKLATCIDATSKQVITLTGGAGTEHDMQLMQKSMLWLREHGYGNHQLIKITDRVYESKIQYMLSHTSGHQYVQLSKVNFEPLIAIRAKQISLMLRNQARYRTVTGVLASVVKISLGQLIGLVPYQVTKNSGTETSEKTGTQVELTAREYSCTKAQCNSIRNYLNDLKNTSIYNLRSSESRQLKRRLEQGEPIESFNYLGAEVITEYHPKKKALTKNWEEEALATTDKQAEANSASSDEEFQAEPVYNNFWFLVTADTLKQDVYVTVELDLVALDKAQDAVLERNLERQRQLAENEFMKAKGQKEGLHKVEAPSEAEVASKQWIKVGKLWIYNQASQPYQKGARVYVSNVPVPKFLKLELPEAQALAGTWYSLTYKSRWASEDHNKGLKSGIGAPRSVGARTEPELGWALASRVTMSSISYNRAYSLKKRFAELKRQKAKLLSELSTPSRVTRFENKKLKASYTNNRYTILNDDSIMKNHASLRTGSELGTYTLNQNLLTFWGKQFKQAYLGSKGLITAG